MNTTLFNTTFESLVNSSDYMIDLRGVRIMNKIPEIYQYQTRAFLKALDSALNKYDLLDYVEPVFFIPYVKDNEEVKNVLKLIVEEKENYENIKKFEKKNKKLQYQVGTLLELHQSARYMEQYLEMGLRHFMIGTNDLIANWNGLQRTTGLKFDDDTTIDALVGNFSDFIKTLSEGISNYETTHGKTKINISMSGELPMRVFQKILEVPGGELISYLGVPPLKVLS